MVKLLARVSNAITSRTQVFNDSTHLEELKNPDEYFLNEIINKSHTAFQEDFLFARQLSTRSLIAAIEIFDCR